MFLKKLILYFIERELHYICLFLHHFNYNHLNVNTGVSYWKSVK